MKTITQEQINQAIVDVKNNIAKNIHQDFCEAAEQIPENLKNNPIAYSEVALAIAQRNTIAILESVLNQLLID